MPSPRVMPADALITGSNNHLRNFAFNVVCNADKGIAFCLVDDNTLTGLDAAMVLVAEGAVVLNSSAHNSC